MLISFLRSKEGRQCLLELLIDIELRSQFDPKLEETRRLLSQEYRNELQRLRRDISQEIEDVAACLHECVREASDGLQKVRQSMSAEIDLADRHLHDCTRVAIASLHQEHLAESEAILRKAANVQRSFKEGFAEIVENIVTRAGDIKQTLEQDVAEFETGIVEQTKLSMAGVVHDVLAFELHRLLRQEVKEFIRSNPVYNGLSNRQIAVANGISLREVKRRRRRGVL